MTSAMLCRLCSLRTNRCSKQIEYKKGLFATMCCKEPLLHIYGLRFKKVDERFCIFKIIVISCELFPMVLHTLSGFVGKVCKQRLLTMIMCVGGKSADAQRAKNGCITGEIRAVAAGRVSLFCTAVIGFAVAVIGTGSVFTAHTVRAFAAIGADQSAIGHAAIRTLFSVIMVEAMKLHFALKAA